MKQYLQHPIFQTIAQVTEKRHCRSFVIGGFVRDIFLHRTSQDIDIVILGNSVQFAEELASELEVPMTVFKNFGTVLLQYHDWKIELVGARKESYRLHSRKPIIEAGTLEEDQQRRDFTINALAVALHPDQFGQLIDPFNGLKDLQNQLIRTPSNAVETFSDDPLRMMRAIRFATQLNFAIDTATLMAIQSNCKRIHIVSQERITDELNKIILARKPSIGFNYLFDTGLLHNIFPQMAQLQGIDYIDGQGHKDNFYHTLEVVDNMAVYTQDLWLRWAAILHDIAKPITKRFEPDHGWTFYGHDERGAKMIPKLFAQLKLPLNEKMKQIQKLVQLHLRPIALAQEVVTDAAIRRLLFDAGADIDNLMLLCKADITTKNECKMKQYYHNFERVQEKLKSVEERDRIRNWQPPISGFDIMNAFGIKEGRVVGRLKNQIREAILDGAIPNARSAAITFMIHKGREIGLHVANQIK